jgi:hypothetical protein
MCKRQYACPLVLQAPLQPVPILGAQICLLTSTRVKACTLLSAVKACSLHPSPLCCHMSHWLHELENIMPTP